MYVSARIPSCWAVARRRFQASGSNVSHMETCFPLSSVYSWAAAPETHFYPFPPSRLLIHNRHSHSHCLSAPPESGCTCRPSLILSGINRTEAMGSHEKRVVKREREWKRVLYLDQSFLDDAAHVEPPFGHIRVLLIQVGWKGQQMWLEIFCRKKNNQYTVDCCFFYFYFLSVVCLVMAGSVLEAIHTAVCYNQFQVGGCGCSVNWP